MPDRAPTLPMDLPEADAAAQDAGSIDLALLIIRETDKGVCVAEEEFGKTRWLPKSLVDIERAARGNAATISLPEWLAREKGLI